MPKRLTPIDFWNRVGPPTDAGCREWIGTYHRDGYGALRYQRRYWLTHRLAWQLTIGPIPASACICHTCDNPACCNPDHLFIGSHADNMADMKRKGRRLNINAGEGNGRAKLTVEQVAKIRRLYYEQRTRQVDLAAQFDVSQTVVSLILRGKIWKDAAMAPSNDQRPA